MEYSIIIKSSFTVLGRLGHTNDGFGFIRKLWKDADTFFLEVKQYVKKDEEGNFVGFWGLMSKDDGITFEPWEENFTKGYYLAGVECEDDSIEPNGWRKWVVPASTYFKVKNKDASFEEALHFMKENDMKLVGACFDYTDPIDKENYMLFPIERG